MNRIRPRHRAAGTVLFLLYLACLIYFLFFAEALGRSGSELYHYNLEPLKEIRRFWLYRESLGNGAFLLNTLGNVLAFLPFGFFLPIVSGRCHDFLTLFFSGALFSGGIELIQLLTRLGSFDVDDILLNTVGAVLGYLIFRMCIWRLERV
ncbi:VanZ like protein [Fusobacterium naviforme]|uniref:Glycopeptide antibiotics resistance protein n=1 Tax=Moryella indoligenes TaxID=371674 RepID=A0AAE4AKA7_9FIRM|nr:VanZ family protein [Moryella indoligenes]KAB0577133.1 VanZ family protein [Fusobacterium naviforme]MDQ0152693.1 glycopeptide antibiotics resistance protein [Moryella indoligenes]PSL10084.1 VanZ like protein [Fusobacterium naviforme]STO27493.1 Predicted integral membrane protein [Fusobacterium naviforme]